MAPAPADRRKVVLKTPLPGASFRAHKHFPALVDGNGAVAALTDGMLILRYMFGISGPSLTAGAIAIGAPRVSPGAVIQYLDVSADSSMSIVTPVSTR
ncbi:MAG: hypothetical protein IPO58_17150 [Betaproteobacteria bacterium]|nr:hypothetical protein [Betaproteobacteria bacterium]